MTDTDCIMVVDRIEKRLKSDFQKWEKEPLGKLPDERDLAIEYGASRQSVRKAIERLRDSRLIKTVPRKGNFILRNPTLRRDMLVSCRSGNSFYSLMSLNVIGSILNEHEIGMKVLTDYGNLGSREITGLDPRTCAGILLVGEHKKEDVQSLVERAGVPLVYVGELNEKYHVPQMCNSILGDNSMLAYRAVDYLIGRGHQKIAVALLDKGASWNRDILLGYQAALERHGIAFEPDFVVDIARPREEVGLYLVADAECVALQIAKWKQKPTAMIHLLMSEIEHEEVMNFLFKGCFSRENVIPMVFRENLELQYSGRTPMTAFCIEYSELVRRAVERILNPEPLSRRKLFTREVLCSINIYSREKGVWTKIEQAS